MVASTTPKQWNNGTQTAEFVIAREFHVFAGQETVIADVVMCQHDALWGIRSCLMVYCMFTTSWQVTFDLSSFQLGVFYVIAQQQDSCVCCTCRGVSPALRRLRSSYKGKRSLFRCPRWQVFSSGSMV